MTVSYRVEGYSKVELEAEPNWEGNAMVVWWDPQGGGKAVLIPAAILREIVAQEAIKMIQKSLTTVSNCLEDTKQEGVPPGYLVSIKGTR